MHGGVFILHRCARDEAGYPALLAALPAPPAALYWRGAAWPPPSRAVAMVGSRSASRYGLEMAWQLAADLARAGVTVVSGMARGVDAAAHGGALSSGGHTVAVLAASPGTAYPPQSRELHETILARGAACSEFPDGTVLRPGLFLRRNRIVAGLALGVIVVEAGPRSGALTTARWARRWGRFVGAVPGDITREGSLGTLALLRGGAVAIGDAGHVLELVERAEPPPSEGGAAARVLAATGAAPASIAVLAARATATVEETRAALLVLELGGSVERRPGGRFARRPADGGGARG